MDRTRVGIVVFDQVEVLDFCGPFEVFAAVRLDEARRRGDPSPFEVVLATASPGPVTATGGLVVLPHHTFDSCPPIDILLVPGGWGTRPLLRDAALLGWLRARAAAAGTVTSVCTGSLLLAAAGVLDGRRATTHWRALDLLRDTFPTVTVEPNEHVVRDGNVVTSAGISAGIDLALRVVADYAGEPIARATARHMEYPYPESNARRVPV